MTSVEYRLSCFPYLRFSYR